ncbi:Uncharacterised protein [Pseudomonas luteola]|uniref:Uncharacterized protein n=1 Tax=Pseudomonas luteola TaxID=47886 RepID=A0A2X2C591_PSELU|nr:Uncharacterised protein [Pseudomonas luteola]
MTTTLQERREQLNVLMEESRAKAKALGIHFDFRTAKLAARRIVLGK